MSNQKRRSAAKPTVTISGFALGLGVFVERVQLMENRAGMACLKGVTHRVEPGNTLEIQYGSGGGILSVVWVGQPCTERAGMIGARWLSANETAAPVAGAIITDASDEGDYAVAV